MLPQLKDNLLRFLSFHFFQLLEFDAMSGIPALVIAHVLSGKLIFTFF